jgi:hypothetical protein
LSLACTVVPVFFTATGVIHQKEANAEMREWRGGRRAYHNHITYVENWTHTKIKLFFKFVKNTLKGKVGWWWRGDRNHSSHHRNHNSPSVEKVKL